MTPPGSTGIDLSSPAVERKRSALHFAIAGQLGVEVISGEIAVGALLPAEQQLCDRFGVSRTVVREAVKLLASKGLLRLSSGIGTWVAPAREWNFLDPLVLSLVRDSGRSVELIRHLFAFRVGVEPAAAAEAARNASQEQIRAIEAAFAVMQEAAIDFDRWIEGDIAFHTALYDASNNMFMAPLANLFREHFRISFRVSSSNFHHQHCLHEHRAVLDAIKAHDGEAARRAVETLLKHADEDVRVVVSK